MDSRLTWMLFFPEFVEVQVPHLELLEPLVPQDQVVLEAHLVQLEQLGHLALHQELLVPLEIAEILERLAHQVQEALMEVPEDQVLVDQMESLAQVVQLEQQDHLVLVVSVVLMAALVLLVNGAPLDPVVHVVEMAHLAQVVQQAQLEGMEVLEGMATREEMVQQEELAQQVQGVLMVTLEQQV